MQKKAIYHFPFDAVHHIGYGADYDCRTGMPSNVRDHRRGGHRCHHSGCP